MVAGTPRMSRMLCILEHIQEQEVLDEPLEVCRMSQRFQKKVKLSVANKHTKWAPFWAVIKKFGTNIDGRNKKV